MLWISLSEITTNDMDNHVIYKWAKRYLYTKTLPVNRGRE